MELTKLSCPKRDERRRGQYRGALQLFLTPNAVVRVNTRANHPPNKNSPIYSFCQTPYSPEKIAFCVRCQRRNLCSSLCSQLFYM